MFECLIKRVNDCNFQGQPSLVLLFSKPEEKAPVLCNHLEIKVEKVTTMYLVFQDLIKLCRSILENNHLSI